MEKSDNKRIAKNAILLYVRMFVLMILNLYISRVVLQYLGVEDYGIYGIVGSVVVLFSCLNSTLSNACSRFLSFEIGEKDLTSVKKVFKASINIHLGLIIVILILAETVGVYVLHHVLTIPQDRLYAANWCFQFTILTFCANIIRIPYNASIISSEHMDFYAYLSVADVMVKLGAIWLLFLLKYDRLIAYSAIMALVAIVISFSYYLYCHLRINYAHYSSLKINNDLYRKILSFSGWSLFSGVANVGSNTGVNMVLNVFCGVTVNAAVAIANQVSNALYQFVSNLQTAFMPQIIKSYAAKEYTSSHILVFRACRFSFLLFWWVTMPVIIAIHRILYLWLGVVPEYATSFTVFIICYLLIDALFNPICVYIDATGRIKANQVVTGILILSNLPIAYFLLFNGCVPTSVWIARIVINLICNTFRLSYLGSRLDFPVIGFFKETLLPIPLVVLFSGVIAFYAYQICVVDTISFICFTILCYSYGGLIVFLLGFTRNEKAGIINMIIGKLGVKNK